MLAVELELWAHIQRSHDHLQCVFQQLDSKVVLLEHDNTVLRVADVESNCELQTLQVDIDSHPGGVDLLVSSHQVVDNWH